MNILNGNSHFLSDDHSGKQTWEERTPCIWACIDRRQCREVRQMFHDSVPNFAVHLILKMPNLKKKNLKEHKSKCILVAA